MTHNDREFNFVLYGATGYTGQLALQYAFSRKVAVEKWAIAGRNREKLEKLIPVGISSPPEIIIVDTSKSEDEIYTQIRALCRRTKVVLTMAGPFAEIGERMMRACMAEKSHYVDITAEMFWVERMVDKYSEGARESGVMLLPCCGFDFTPNDLMLHQMAQIVKKNRGSLRRVIHAFQQSTPTVSGGTVQSGLRMMKDIPLTQAIKAYTDPYQLCRLDKRTALHEIPKDVIQVNSHFLLPDVIPKHQDTNDSKDAKDADQSENQELRGYCVPFVMSALMAKYVHWSNMIQGYPWGKSLVYHGGEHRYNVVTAYLFCLVIWMQYLGSMLLARLPLVVRKVLPQPGTGAPICPKTSYMQAILVAEADYPSTDPKTPTRVTRKHSITWRLDGREAYAYAAASAIEAAIIVSKITVPKEQAGFTSPSAVMGDKLIQALEEMSDVKMTIDLGPQPALETPRTHADTVAETRPTTQAVEHTA